ncbi:outer membrane lipid asymmetry maintenance protein MlaD [Betaproteobacteria bacterium]|nr:outer membrane lipid asymmetry maintenance protein MlaD [Betaproteobacteria bacterium]GHU47831.1 outer membrane lipid asymmetry maintenance protein MlaD [Betaproteobacteria bacterium]
MNRSTLDLWVGFFVVIGIGALLFLALKVSGFSGIQMKDAYAVQARFDNIGGLKIKAPVRSAGVLVGRVTDIHLDNDTYEALVEMHIDKRYSFPKDSAAGIYTAGLLGDQYVGLTYGADERPLAGGDTIKKTQSAVVLEQLISQFLFNKAAEGQNQE